MSTSPDTHAAGLELGRVAGRYELLSRIAQGGMGEVFAARELATSRPLALKRLLPAAEKRRASFQAEYHVLARLKHPFIIEVYDFGVDKGLPYYTMELLDGYDLRRAPVMGIDEGCRILRDVTTSLALLHAQRLLHRDVSPSNIRHTVSGVCKLIDFGTMVPFGVPPDIAGTPAFIAPEALEGGELDQRADLYSLGAVAYWLFSRRLPGSARSFERTGYKYDQLPLLRKVADSVPVELEELVMSLLELDPSKRPNSAQEVIARLSVIGKLLPGDSSSLVGAHLGSSRFVGQKRALANAEKLLRRASAGHGGGALAEGSEGSGKTRFLQEVSLRAQTEGFSVVRTSASRSGDASAIARELYRGLKRVAPQAGEQVPQAEREALAALDRDELTVDALEGAERRGQLVWALAAYLRVVVREGPWLLVVDDLDRADGTSIGLVAALAALAEDLPLLVLASAGARCGEGHAQALASFAERAQRIELSALSAARTHTLVSDLLGHVPNRERVVDFLYRGARGNPGITIELCRFLMERGLVRYVDGTFVLPEGEIRERLPVDALHAFTMRLEGLSNAARELANLIASCRAGASLELCLSASDEPPERVLSAVHELVSRGVLMGGGDAYVFAQEAARAAVRHALSTERRRELHERLAAAFEALADGSLLSSFEAALHLVHTEREREGAERLTRLAPALIEAGVACQDASEALEKALEVLERHGAPLSTRLAVRTHLARASYTHDFRLADRYAEDTVALIRAWCGMTAVEKARRFLPSPCGALLCLLIIAYRRLVRPKLRRGPGPVLSLQYFGRIMMSTLGVRLTALDRPRSTQLVQQMWICRELRSIGVLGALHQAAGALLLQMHSREVGLREQLTRVLKRLEGPVALMQEAERQDMRVGLLLSAGVNEAYRLGGKALSVADELTELGTGAARASAHRVRFTYFATRGMRERADQCRRELDMHALQGGTTWQVDWFALPMEGMTSVRLGDLVGATRALAGLERLANEVPALALLRDMVTIGSLAGRGEHARALELGQDFVARHPPKSTIGWGTVYAAVAASLNHLGRYAEARERCERAFAALSREDLEYDHMYGALFREHALAHAGMGEIQRALAISGAYVARLEAAGEYALLAYAHECRARLAHMTGDHELLADALSAVRDAAERSGSGAVGNQVAKLLQASLRAMRAGDCAASEWTSDQPASSTTATAPDRVGRKRTSTLLKRVMQHARASSALVLVLSDQPGEPLVAASAGQTLDLEVLRPALHSLLFQLASEAGEPRTRKLIVADHTFAVVTLNRPHAREAPVVLVVAQSEEESESVPPTLLSELVAQVRSELGFDLGATESFSDSASAAITGPG